MELPWVLQSAKHLRSTTTQRKEGERARGSDDGPHVRGLPPRNTKRSGALTSSKTPCLWRATLAKKGGAGGCSMCHTRRAALTITHTTAPRHIGQQRRRGEGSFCHAPQPPESRRQVMWLQPPSRQMRFLHPGHVLTFSSSHRVEPAPQTGDGSQGQVGDGRGGQTHG